MRLLLIFALTLVLGGPAGAHSYKAGSVLIGHPWAAPTPGSDTEVYFSLLNRATAADYLVAVAAPSAAAVEIVDAGSVRIGGIELAPGKPVSLKPGGIRLRLIGIDRPLRVGDKLKLTLIFARGGTVPIEVMVEAGPSHG